MSVRDVFPRRNLPGDAEQWGRTVEDRIESGEDSDVQLEQRINNMGRATAGQLSVMSRQITELFEGRRSFTGTAEDVQYTYNATSGSRLIGTVPITVSSPMGGARAANLFFTYAGRKLAGNISGFDVWVEVLYNDSTVWRSPSRMWVGPSASIPPGWDEGVLNGSTSLTVVPSGTGSETFSLRFWSYDFDSDPGRTVEFFNMSVTVMYSDLVD